MKLGLEAYRTKVADTPVLVYYDAAHRIVGVFTDDNRLLRLEPAIITELVNKIPKDVPKP